MEHLPVRRRDAETIESTKIESQYAVDLFSRANPRSLINILPDDTAKKIEKAYQERKELFTMNEKELKRECKPTPTDNRLRLAFWAEYDLAQEKEAKMFLSHVYGGICTQQYWDFRYLADVKNVAWLLCPPTNYIAALNEILVRAQDRMSEILDLPLEDADGKINMKLAELQFKIFLAAENRAKGATVQRTELRGEIRSVNLNLGAAGKESTTGLPEVMQLQSMEEIEAKLKKLRSRKNQDIEIKPESE